MHSCTSPHSFVTYNLFLLTYSTFQYLQEMYIERSIKSCTIQIHIRTFSIVFNLRKSYSLTYFLTLICIVQDQIALFLTYNSNCSSITNLLSLTSHQTIVFMVQTSTMCVPSKARYKKIHQRNTSQRPVQYCNLDMKYNRRKIGAFGPNTTKLFAHKKEVVQCLRYTIITLWSKPFFII